METVKSGIWSRIQSVLTSSFWPPSSLNAKCFSWCFWSFHPPENSVMVARDAGHIPRGTWGPGAPWWPGGRRPCANLPLEPQEGSLRAGVQRPCPFSFFCNLFLSAKNLEKKGKNCWTPSFLRWKSLRGDIFEIRAQNELARVQKCYRLSIYSYVYIYVHRARVYVRNISLAYQHTWRHNQCPNLVWENRHFKTSESCSRKNSFSPRLNAIKVILCWAFVQASPWAFVQVGYSIS